MKILVVDDNENSRIILKKILEPEGYTVDMACNGEEALKVARESAPDMIISDILMPVMDGFRLCSEVKADDNLRHIPFVFYTATYTDFKDEELALSLGAERFIVKPMAPDELMRIIEETIRDVEEGKAKALEPAPEEEKAMPKLYNKRLVKKLEKKMLDLEIEIAKRREAEESLRKANDELHYFNQELEKRFRIGPVS